MELKEVAAVSGRGGLFKIVKPTKTGVILETIENQPKRLVAGSSEKVSILNEISIYTTDAEGSVALELVFQAIKKKFSDALPVQAKSTPEELKNFLVSVLPSFDQERVYASDIKKLVSWYILLNAYDSTIFIPKETEVVETVEKEVEKATAKKKAAKASESIASSEEDSAKPVAKKAAKKATKKDA
ncbi:MAG: DUF5606 domain-containing protein [Cytophagaceae bacterium]|jgi:hypothetical protein|nr:DUF5606 domain-containing protein [Cytophagaceae bacterium]